MKKILRSFSLYEMALFDDLNNRPEAYGKGYSDGLSCCDLHGLTIAHRLARMKITDLYSKGKQQAASDWLARAK